jgi:site-specific DNA-methyltransferase (cytosine-N4-specific)
LLTDPNDLVLDPFAGSNTTGQVAEAAGRRWIAIEQEPEFVANSRLRFGGLLE